MTLAIEGLTVRYRTPGGDVAALADVSLALAQRPTLAVVGESGSGKSTIALAVMGLLPAEAQIAAGRILFQGRDVLTLDRESRRKLRGAGMALVFQDPFSVLNPSMRVGAQIGEGLVYHRGLTREAAPGARGRAAARGRHRRAAQAVASAYPHELSGGMRQRALIAGALAAEPDLLVLDEPTTALDVTIEAQILDLLEELQARRGLATLFISHNLGVVRRIADEVAVLYAGQVVEQGPTADVLAHPLHPYTKGLLAAVPRLGASRGRARLHSRAAARPARADRRLPLPAALPLCRGGVRRAAGAAARCGPLGAMPPRGRPRRRRRGPSLPRSARAAARQRRRDPPRRWWRPAASPRPSRCRAASPRSPSRAGGRATGRRASAPSTA